MGVPRAEQLMRMQGMNINLNIHDKPPFTGSEDDQRAVINLLRTSALFRWASDESLGLVVNKLTVKKYQNVRMCSYTCNCVSNRLFALCARNYYFVDFVDFD